jgi:hypothetical protein
LVQIAHQFRDFLNVKEMTVICLLNVMMAIFQQAWCTHVGRSAAPVGRGADGVDAMA